MCFFQTEPEPQSRETDEVEAQNCCGNCFDFFRENLSLYSAKQKPLKPQIQSQFECVASQLCLHIVLGYLFFHWMQIGFAKKAKACKAPQRKQGHLKVAQYCGIDSRVVSCQVTCLH